MDQRPDPRSEGWPVPPGHRRRRLPGREKVCSARHSMCKPSPRRAFRVERKNRKCEDGPDPAAGKRACAPNTSHQPAPYHLTPSPLAACPFHAGDQRHTGQQGQLAADGELTIGPRRAATASEYSKQHNQQECSRSARRPAAGRTDTRPKSSRTQIGKTRPHDLPARAAHNRNAPLRQSRAPTDQEPRFKAHSGLGGALIAAIVEATDA